MKRFFILSMVTLIGGIAAILGLETNAAAQGGIKFNPKAPIVLKRLPDIQIVKDAKKDIKKDVAKVAKKVLKTDIPKVGKKGVVDPAIDPAKDPAAKDPIAKGEKIQKAIEVITAVKDLIQAVRGNGNGIPGGGVDQGGGGFPGGGVDQGGGGFPAGGADTAPMTGAPQTSQDITGSPKKDVVDDQDAKVRQASFDDKAKSNTAKPGDSDTESGDKAAEREQVFTRRLVKVKNDTDMPIKVFVQFRGLEDKKWTWIPADPTEAQDALVFELKPGQERYLTYRNDKIAASRMRIWGVGEAQSWLDYRDKDLWAVPETDPRGEHRYLATEMRTFSHVFTPEVVGDK